MAQELAAIEREKDLERRIRKMNMEAGNDSSLKSVRTSIKAEDKTKRWVTSPIKKFGETRDPLVNVATVKSNYQQICNPAGNTSAPTGTDEMRLDVFQFNVAPGKPTDLIYDSHKLFIPFTVRQRAALPAYTPHNQMTQVLISQSTPNLPASMKLQKPFMTKSLVIHWKSRSGPDSFYQQLINILLMMV